MRSLLRLLPPLCLWLMAGCSPVVILNATVPSSGVERLSDIRYADRARGTLDLYRPAGAAGPAAKLPVVVFLFGGSWRTGEKGMYPFVGRPLAARGVLVAVPDYRTFPATGIPGILDDSAQAVAWVLAHAAEYGGDPGRVFVMGHSSGAYDAMMLALDPRWMERAGSDRKRLAGAIGLAGPYDFLPLKDPDVIEVFGADATPAFQPITYAGGQQAAVAPPLLLRAGADDRTVRPGNTPDLAARLRANGGQVDAALYPGIGHIGIITAFAPLFDGRAPVLDEVARFVTQPAGAQLGVTAQRAAVVTR